MSGRGVGRRGAPPSGGEITGERGPDRHRRRRQEGVSEQSGEVRHEKGLIVSHNTLEFLWKTTVNGH